MLPRASLPGASRTATATIECASFVELLTLSLKSLQRVLDENRVGAQQLLRESAVIRDHQADVTQRRRSYDDSESAKEAVARAHAQVPEGGGGGGSGGGGSNGASFRGTRMTRFLSADAIVPGVPSLRPRGPSPAASPEGLRYRVGVPDAGGEAGAHAQNEIEKAHDGGGGA